MIEFEAKSEGIDVFNALAIGLGVELLSNRVNPRKNTDGYRKLLTEFAVYHPNFIPATWEHLIDWLSYYNNPHDLQLILAPVLFNLNQSYRAQQNKNELVLEELAQLILKNKAGIVNDASWHQLRDNHLFPEIEALSLEVKRRVLANLKPILATFTGKTSASAKILLRSHQDITADILPHIDLSAIDYNRGYGLNDLTRLSTALSLNLSNSLSPVPSKVNIMLRLKQIAEGVRAGEQTWVFTTRNYDEELLSDNGVSHLGEQSMQQAMNPEYRSTLPDITPQQLAAHKDKKIDVRRLLVDNPGRGNCGFYAFAIGLIHIIQQEGPSSTAMFQHWCRVAPSVTDYYHGNDKIEALHKQLLAFNFKSSTDNTKLLNHLQSGLRNCLYVHRLNELKEACANPGIRNNNILANSTYIDFSLLFTRESLPIDRAPGDNIFADSKEFKTAIDVARTEQVSPISFFIRSLYGSEARLEDITLDIELDDKLPAVRALANIKKDSIWATSQDLQKLATFFRVNYNMLINGAPRQFNPNEENLPTITLNCIDRGHWQTQIYVAQEVKKHNHGSALLATVPSNGSGVRFSADKSKLDLTRAASGHQLPLSRLSLMGEPTHSDAHAKAQTSVPVTLQVKPEKKVAFAKTPDFISRSFSDTQSTKKKAISAKPKRTLDEDSDHKLAYLKSKLTTATIEYTNYSESIWFSFFHRHGQTGRNRAASFHSSFSGETDYDKARQDLLIYLRNPKNGNTHPHSYRTMLLHELLKDKHPEHSLLDTSKKYAHLLDELSNSIDPYPVYSV